MGLFDKIKQTTDEAKNRVDTIKQQAAQAQHYAKNAIDAAAGKPISQEDAKAAFYAEEDKRSVWINVGADKWVATFDCNRMTVDAPKAFTVGEKNDFLFTLPDGKSELFKVTSRMKAYSVLKANTHRKLQKLFIMRVENDEGHYYRIKVVFVK